LVIPPIIFTVEGPSDVRVVAACEGFKDTVFLQKRVVIGDIPTS
jgi:hypothetical protein